MSTVPANATPQSQADRPPVAPEPHSPDRHLDEQTACEQDLGEQHPTEPHAPEQRLPTWEEHGDKDDVNHGRAGLTGAVEERAAPDGMELEEVMTCDTPKSLNAKALDIGAASSDERAHTCDAPAQVDIPTEAHYNTMRLLSDERVQARLHRFAFVAITLLQSLVMYLLFRTLSNPPCRIFPFPCSPPTSVAINATTTINTNALAREVRTCPEILPYSPAEAILDSFSFISRDCPVSEPEELNVLAAIAIRDIVKGNLKTSASGVAFAEALVDVVDRQARGTHGGREARLRLQACTDMVTVTLRWLWVAGDQERSKSDEEDTAKE